MEKVLGKPKRFTDKISPNELFSRFKKDEVYINFRKLIPKEDFDIKFDLENLDYHSPIYDEITGAIELEDRVFIGFQSGGDWEYPVYLILYLQDNKWRVYIPKEGNLINKDTMRAFGSGEEESGNTDLKYLQKIMPEEFADDEDDDFEIDDCEMILNIDAIRKDILNNVGVSSSSEE